MQRLHRLHYMTYIAKTRLRTEQYLTSEIRSSIEHLIQNCNIIVLVSRLKFTKNLISLAGFNMISYDLSITR